MARILTKLSIDEISSVDKGAGENCKIVLMKRDHDTPQHRPLLFNDIMKLTAQQMHDKKRRNAERLMDELSEDEDSKRLTKEQPMSRTEELLSIAKADGGMAMICKNIIERGTTTISEHEFSAALMEHAKHNRRDRETVEKAFSRMIEEDVEIRRAYGITKGYPDVMNMRVSSVEVGSTVTADDSKKAYDDLMAMAREMHRTSPAKTVEQCFAIVMQQNPDLAAKAHRRPTASSPSYDALMNKTAGRRDLTPPPTGRDPNWHSSRSMA